MYPDFQYISFHEQSDRVSFLEGKVFHYGWIFLPFSFFTENWKVFITSILMKIANDLEIIRGDIHIRICKHPYHTSVDVLPRLCCMRPTKSQISLGPHILISAFVMNTNIKHFVGPGLGQTCWLIISAADMKIKSDAFMPRAVLRVGYWRIKADFAHKT